ncbi:MAG: histidine kinase dimerization/phosphoacceptor domain -containing protein [Gracilimonas sp.]|nr:histidine kinase dimerization/phosphoacceptor domain -containing protein [Gracilimonas sp.]
MKNRFEKNALDVDRKMIGLFMFGTTCAVLLILSVTLAVNFTSGIRGYVGGEGHWTKAQKESVIHLSQYIISEDESDFRNFKSALRIIMGDRTAREELNKEDYNYEIVFQGFKKGLNHPEDIPHMIQIFDWFHDYGPVKEAIQIWESADYEIDTLVAFADTIHFQIQNEEVSTLQKTEWMRKLNHLDHELTDLELRFSDSMDRMARMLNTGVKWTTIILGLIIIGIGLWLTRRFYVSTKIWTQTIRESENKFRNVINNSQDILFKVNLKTKNYEYVSPALQSMLGYDIETFMAGGMDFILSKMHPDDKDEIQGVVDQYDNIDEKDHLPALEYRLKDVEGNWVWVSSTRNIVRNQQGEPEAIVGTVRDISVRKEQEQKIKKSLEEKELLLQEIHHRVKNNLSIISSLLELQKDGMPEPVQEILSASQLRIKSIAKVHEKLYKSTNLSDTSLDNYISELANEIKKTYHSDKQSIDIQLDVIPVSVSINDAIPIGLIINELINNAFKHAFNGQKSGSLRISLDELESSDQLQMLIKSDGNKLDDDFDIKSSDSLGMTLIQILVKRIHGALNVYQEGKWSVFQITFSLNK